MMFFSEISTQHKTLSQKGLSEAESCKKRVKNSIFGRSRITKLQLGSRPGSASVCNTDVLMTVSSVLHNKYVPCIKKQSHLCKSGNPRRII